MKLDRTGIALDIDNTLCATNLYWASQLLGRFGHPEGKLAEELLAQHRNIDAVPEWQTDEAQAWMDIARTSSDLQKDLPLIENANHMVNRITQIVPVAAYLTGRPEMVREGTQHWLDRHEFPAAPVIMRPAEIAHDGWTRWKAQTLHELYPQLLGIIDDDPFFVDEVPATYGGTIFMYNMDTHARADIDIICCRDWDKVLARVEEKFGS